MNVPNAASRRASNLAAGYEKSHRRWEMTGIFLFFACEARLLLEMADGLVDNAWLLATTAITGFVASDFLSGLVHWLGDTWGHPDLPVLGRGFIRPFREHHVDQAAITRHDFVETNGNNCLATLVALLPLSLVPMDPGRPWAYGVVAFFVFLTFGVFATNQFHKWAHAAEPPAIARYLQHFGLILSPDHHARHHAAPYDSHYCITTGWLNRPLAWVDFFGRSERLITRFTGYLPRQDDLRAE